MGSAEFAPPFRAKEFAVDISQMQRGGTELTAEELDLQRDTAIRDTASRAIIQMLESTLSQGGMDATSASVIRQIIESVGKR